MNKPAFRNTTKFTRKSQQIGTNYVKITWASRMLGISPHTLRRLEEKGIITPLKLPNDHRLYNIDDIKKLQETFKKEKETKKTKYEKRKTKARLNKKLEATIKGVKNLNNLLLGILFLFSISLFTMTLSLDLPYSIKNLLGSKKESRVTKTPTTKSPNILAAKGRITDFIFSINIPSIFTSEVTTQETLTAEGLVNILGGLTTNTLTFTGVGTMNNLLGIDDTTETTLEEALDINGEVTGTGLDDVVIADGVIDETKLADEIEYDGDFDFTGTVSIAGGQISATASEINYLSGAAVSAGGVVFGNGSKFTQDSTNFFWDNTLNRLGIGTSSPTAFLDLPASNSGAATLRMRSGSAPTSPNTGDFYSDGSNIYYYNGSSWDDLTGGGSADTLDNLDSTQFLRSDATDTFEVSGGGTLYIAAGNYLDVLGSLYLNGSAITATANEINVLNGMTSSTAELNYLDGISITSIGVVYTDGSKFANTGEGTSGYLLQANGTAPPSWLNPADLDAGTLDGIDVDSFLRSDTSDQFTSGTLTTNAGTILDVNGDLLVADNDIAFDNTSYTNFNFTNDFSINDNNFFLDKQTAFIGLGNTAPSERLMVNGRVYLAQTTAPSPTTDRLYNVSGDLYWDGTKLNTSGATLYSTNGTAPAGSYIEVTHSQSTYDVLATGWIQSGSSWVEIDDLGSVTHNSEDPELVGWYKMEEASGTLDNAEGTAAQDIISKSDPNYQQVGKINYSISLSGNDYLCSTSSPGITTCSDNDAFDFDTGSFTLGGWFKHSTMSGTNPDYIIAKYDDSPTIDIGDGADGAITAGTAVNINTVNLISGRTCVDGGDAVNYNITSFSQPDMAILNSTPSEGCLVAGDEILIINLQGTNSAYSNVGNYETLDVESVSGNIITFTTAKTKYYGDGASDDTNLGVIAGTQRVMLQRVPNYTSVTVNAGQNFYPSDWGDTSGPKGGVMFFRATGAVAINGTIHANHLGYDGGDSYVPSSGGEGGEAFCGPGGAGSTTGNGGNGAAGGGSFNPYNGGTGYCGGGGGGNTTKGNGSNTAGGAGGGGSYYAAGGGGGGYGTIGKGGISSVGGAGNGVDGGTNTSGDGGVNGYGGAGGGGGTYGSADLEKLFFGSGGGHGGRYLSEACDSGGDGGGIVFIAANSVTVSGALESKGRNGGGSGSNSGGGGGGGGGSVKVIGNTVNLGITKTVASGGSGNGTYPGGNGGGGRIAVEYTTSTSGSAAPTYLGTRVAPDAGGYKLYMESDGDITFGIDDDDSSFAEDSATTTNADYDDNKWHHVVAVKDGSNSIKLYIDGTEVASDYSLAADSSLSNSGPFLLGVDEDQSTDKWDGGMDEVFVYNRVLSAGEIKELYQSNSRFRIEQPDNNNVRLYNDTIDTQTLRLDIIASGADLAEWYTVNDQTIEAGDIVAISGDLDRYGTPIIRKTIKEYDPQTIGIISTKAGQEMGIKRDDRKLVALSGRVSVKIDPNSPDINAGDYITSSGISGLGQRATGIGKVIGIALENWTGNKPTILVLVDSTWFGIANDTLVDNTSKNILEEMLELRDEVITNFNEFIDFSTSLGISKENNTLAVSADMNILGDLTLNNLNVGGNLLAGAVKIDTTKNAINIAGPACTTGTLCQIQTLYLQKNSAGNVDLFDGEIVLEPDGSITIKKLILEKDKTAGSSIIKTGDMTVFVTTDAITIESKVMITPTKLIEALMAVTNKLPNEGFEVSLTKAAVEDITFDWMIVDTK